MKFKVNRATGTVHRSEPTERCNSDAARRSGNIVVSEGSLRDVLLVGRRHPCGWCLKEEPTLDDETIEETTTTETTEETRRVVPLEGEGRGTATTGDTEDEDAR